MWEAMELPSGIRRKAVDFGKVEAVSSLSIGRGRNAVSQSLESRFIFEDIMSLV